MSLIIIHKDSIYIGYVIYSFTCTNILKIRVCVTTIEILMYSFQFRKTIMSRCCYMALFLKDNSENNTLNQQILFLAINLSVLLCIELFQIINSNPAYILIRIVFLFVCYPTFQPRLYTELQDLVMIDLSLVMQIFLKSIVNLYSMLQVHLHPAFNLVPLSIL